MPVVRIESSSGGEMPAFLKATSTLPKVLCAWSNRAFTCSASVTSTCTYEPLSSSARAGPRPSSMSPKTTFAPSAANRRAVARPIPEHPPVITATLLSSRPAIPLSFTLSNSGAPRTLRGLIPRILSGLGGLAPRGPGMGPASGGEKDVLDLGECVRGVRAEFAAEAGLFETSEGRPVAHRGVRVDRQVARLDAAGHSQREADVGGEDRAGQPVVRVVRLRNRIRLV